MSEILENFETVCERIQNPISRRTFMRVVGGVLGGVGMPRTYGLELQSMNEARKLDIPMVMFHLEGPGTVARNIGRFQNQGRTAITASQAVDLLTAENPRLSLDGSYYVLTFDDGYLMQHDQILPLLVRLGVPATFFVLGWSWWGDNVHSYMRKLQLQNLWLNGMDIQSHGISHRGMSSIFRTSGYYIDIYNSKIQIRGDLTDGEDNPAIPEIVIWCYPNGDGATNPLIHDDLREAGYVAAVSVIDDSWQTADKIMRMGRGRPM